MSIYVSFYVHVDVQKCCLVLFVHTVFHHVYEAMCQLWIKLWQTLGTKQSFFFIHFGPYSNKNLVKICLHDIIKPCVPTCMQRSDFSYWHQEHQEDVSQAQSEDFLNPSTYRENL